MKLFLKSFRGESHGKTLSSSWNAAASENVSRAPRMIIALAASVATLAITQIAIGNVVGVVGFGAAAALLTGGRLRCIAGRSLGGQLANSSSLWSQETKPFSGPPALTG